MSRGGAVRWHSGDPDPDDFDPEIDDEAGLSPHSDLIRAALAVADDLDQRLYPAVGVIRQLARLVATMPAEKSAVLCRGPGCAQILVQPPRGRRRLYCSTRCKSRATKRRVRKGVETFE